MFFVTATVIFLLVIAISAVRIRVMSELDEEESTGIAQASSYTIDGEEQGTN